MDKFSSSSLLAEKLVSTMAFSFEARDCNDVSECGEILKNCEKKKSDEK